ncbi:MAG: protein kinase [Planctomycetes bacterium]|nr:protein kinase [Planctomycetota bacterium]
MPVSATDSVLEKLVLAGGFLPPDAVAAARQRAEAEGIPLRDALVRAGMAPEVLASLETAARSASSTSGATAPRPPSTDVTVLSAGATVVSPSGTNLPRRAPGKLTHIGKYEIIGEIGRGGMGVVYKARHPGLDRVVAVKTLLSPGSPEHLERFQREARSAARMGKHPNLVQVHDVGEEGGIFYFTMEFVEGRGFDREIHEEKPPPRRVAQVVEQVARGLAHAHAEGVVHRDLKPSNVLIDATGRPLLTDFGLAKEVGAGSSVSVAGQVLGTPAYMSPEQAEGKLEQVHERSDVYGLGTVLYEGLTRKPPFEGQGNIEILRKVTGQEPVAPSRLATGIPRDLEVICLKCLSKRAEDRYESAAALADDLQRFLDNEPILARPIPWTVRLARRARKNVPIVVLGATAAALLVTGSLVTLRLVREREDKQREKARLEAATAAAEAKRARVEEAVRGARGALEKGERALRPDVVALSGQAADRAVFDAAATRCDAALAEDGAHLEARSLRARALRLAGRHVEAIEEAGRALALKPGDPAALVERTHATLDLLRTAVGNLSIAYYPGLASLQGIQRRRTWVNADPSAAALREQARADVDRLATAELAPGLQPFFKGMILALDAHNNDAAALEAFDQAIAADPHLVEAYRNRAYVLKRMERPEALAAYRDLVRAQPYDAELQAELAFLEDSKEATLRAIDAAVDLAPGSAWVHAQRGTIHFWYDMDALAEADFKRALALAPDHPGALYGLFTVCEARGAYLEADRLLAHWIRLAPPDPLLWWEAGAYYRVTCRHDLALPCFEKALELDPGYPLYLWARGRSKVLLGKYAEGAKDMFDSVAAGNLEPTARKLYDALRANLEKQIAKAQSPLDAAKFSESLAGFLRLALGMTGSEDRKRQYEASIDNVLILASELYEQAEKFDKARETYQAVTNKAASHWGRDFVLARIAAREYDKPRAFEHLRAARVKGMTSLDGVRIDAGFFRLRDADEWVGYVKEHEGE